jgi:hemolysin III
MAGSALELGLLRRLRTRWLAVAIYVAMGWVALVAFEPLHAHLAPGGLALLIAGGATYTLGVPFYLCRRLPFHHAVWHGFVLAGSVLHYLAVLLYVIPG